MSSRHDKITSGTALKTSEHEEFNEQQYCQAPGPLLGPGQGPGQGQGPG